ncbi:MAG: hypothetical protein K2J82_12530, partial [Muribaculaceae bacterium]|nr:hypothetical protein [Muribaculaceae bacterium]
MRSRRVDLHVFEVVQNLKHFFKLKASGLSTLDILRGGRNKEEIKDLEYEIDRTAWLTAMIKAGDRECIDWLTEAMTSENNSNRMTHSYFKAIVMSGNPELLELEGKLLLAARLQEGLRQAIVETMDAGTTESYRHLLQVIVDNNLQRFAAIKRGLAVTTGLDESEAPERITDKYISLVHQYVNDREAARQAVESEDAMEIYLGLWALSFFDADDVKEPMESLIATAPSYRVQAAMLALETLQFYSLLCTRLASLALRSRHDDHAIVAGALPMYLLRPRAYYRPYYYNQNTDRQVLNDYFSSREEAEADFEILIGILDSMKGDETFAPYVFPWNVEKLTRSELARKLAFIASLLDDNVYIERSLQYLPFIDSYPRAGIIKNMMERGESRKKIEFVVKGMADRATEVRDTCCEIVVKLHKEGKLEDTDYHSMEEHLRLKASNMRIAIINILSSLPEEVVKETIRRLLSDKTADRRLAALDIIKNWIDKGEKVELVKSLLPEVEEIRKPTSKEKVLISSIIDSYKGDTNIYNVSNGFGLYNPSESLELKVCVSDKTNLEEALTFRNKKRPAEILQKIMSLIEENADYEFKNNWGETMRLGNTPKYERYGRGVKSLAKSEMWVDFYKKEIGTPADILRLQFAISCEDDYKYDAPFIPIIRRVLGKAIQQKFIFADFTEKPYYNQAMTVLECLIEEYIGSPQNRHTAIALINHITTELKPEEMVKEYKKGYYSNESEHDILSLEPLKTLTHTLMSKAKADEELFLASFASRYEYYRKLGFKKDFNPINPDEYLRLWKHGLINDSELWHEMMGREDSPQLIKAYTSRLPEAPRRYRWQKELQTLSPELSKVVRKAIDRILDIELQRGDTPTIV